MSREIQVTFDCARPAVLADFWCEALGYAVEAPPEGFDSWPAFLASVGVPESEWDSRSAARPVQGSGPRLFFQRVPEGKSAKNRLHLDIRSATGLEGEERMAALDAEAERLAALGGRILRRVEADRMAHGIVVMADPEGNEFCLD